MWGVVSLTGLPPLADPAIAERGSPLLVAVVVVTVPLYLVAAVRTFLLYRRRRSAVLLSLLTADALKWEPKRSYDAILLDAPCSASGTWGLMRCAQILPFGG